MYFPNTFDINAFLIALICNSNVSLPTENSIRSEINILSLFLLYNKIIIIIFNIIYIYTYLVANEKYADPTKHQCLTLRKMKVIENN